MRNIEHARRLRREGTPAERALWAVLRDRQLGVKFRRQRPLGPFVVDFVSIKARLVVEIDGGQHFEDDAVVRDAERTSAIEARGLRVLRFTNREVLGSLDVVVEVIARACGRM